MDLLRYEVQSRHYSVSHTHTTLFGTTMAMLQSSLDIIRLGEERRQLKTPCEQFNYKINDYYNHRKEMSVVPMR